MGLRMTIADVAPNEHDVWVAKLSGAEVRRIGEPRLAVGARSVIGVFQAVHDPERETLSFDPQDAVVLNVGSGKTAIFVEWGTTGSELRDGNGPIDIVDPPPPTIRGIGDQAFVADCAKLLRPDIASLGRSLVAEVRSKFPGELREGLARKWVNTPDNFLAITIQNRDQSFAVHAKGAPGDFNTPSLDIKQDRGSYVRFKLHRPDQLADAVKVVLASASRR